MYFEAYRERLDGAAFAVLGTHGLDGRLDLVPCCFAVAEPGPTLVTAIDHKPKRTARLARLENIERNPAVTLLVDHRNPQDWSELWWIRAQGTARVVADGEVHRGAVDALVAKYPQYQQIRTTGPAVCISVARWRSWGL